MTTFQKGSDLVLTFDRSVFLRFLWPLLPAATHEQVMLKFDLNSRPNLLEWRRFLVLLLDDCVYVITCVSCTPCMMVIYIDNSKAMNYCNSNFERQLPSPLPPH